LASQFHVFFKRVIYGGRGIAAIHNIVLPAPSYDHWYRLHALNARNSQQMAGCIAIRLFFRCQGAQHTALGKTTDYLITLKKMYSRDSFVYSHDEHGSFVEYAAYTHWDIP
jgi:hypothetical protein